MFLVDLTFLTTINPKVMLDAKISADRDVIYILVLLRFILAVAQRITEVVFAQKRTGIVAGVEAVSLEGVGVVPDLQRELLG